MVEYKCKICNKIFNKKYQYTNHSNRKYPCKSNEINKPKIGSQMLSNGSQMIPKTDFLCGYCNKSFSKSANLNRHIKNTCKVKKRDDENKQKIFDSLIKEMEELKHKVSEMDKLKKQIDKQEQEIIILKKKDKNKITNSNNTNTNTNSNNINSNNNINLIAFGKETLDKINKQDLLDSLKKGFQATVELTKKMHFNPNIPEQHNVYTPSLKDNHSMIFDGIKWNAKPTETVIDELYDNKKAILIDCVEELNPKLNDTQQRSLERWQETLDDHKRIINVKKTCKLLLYNERDVPINTKKNTKEITN
jgi:hypothetical protein